MDTAGNTEAKDKSQPANAHSAEAIRQTYDLQESIGYLLRSANQYAVGRFNNYMAEIAGHSSITTTQFATLTTIARFPGISFSALSAFTSIDMPTLNPMIARLVGRNLVMVQVNPEDKRSRCLFLTTEGRAITEQLERHGQGISEFISENLSQTETQRLAKLLKKLVG